MSQGNAVAGLNEAISTFDIGNLVAEGYEVTIRLDGRDEKKELCFLTLIKSQESATFHGTYSKCIMWATTWAKQIYE